MNEEDKKVDNMSLVNEEEGDKTYSYQFDPNKNSDDFSSEEKDQQDGMMQNKYIGGYQLNHGKTLARTISNTKSSSRYPYGIRGNWNSGIISVLGIAIILGILVLIITFLVV